MLNVLSSKERACYRFAKKLRHKLGKPDNIYTKDKKVIVKIVIKGHVKPKILGYPPEHYDEYTDTVGGPTLPLLYDLYTYNKDTDFDTIIQDLQKEYYYSTPV